MWHQGLARCVDGSQPEQDPDPEDSEKSECIYGRMETNPGRRITMQTKGLSSSHGRSKLAPALRNSTIERQESGALRTSQS